MSTFRVIESDDRTFIDAVRLMGVTRATFRRSEMAQKCLRVYDLAVDFGFSGDPFRRFGTDNVIVVRAMADRPK